MVPNGGYDRDVRRWIYPKSKRFLFPVRVMSKMFRGAFLRELDHAFTQEKMVWCDESWRLLRKNISQKGFNVYSKIPFGGPEQIIKYLARYSHRVAITNNRIIEVTNEKVSFRYRDYRDGKTKKMQLTPSQFTQRFLQHVLPKGLAKIRHYGIFANRNKNRLIPDILLFFERRRKACKVVAVKDVIQYIFGVNLDLCPICHQGKLIRLELPVHNISIRGSPKLVTHPMPYSQVASSSYTTC